MTHPISPDTRPALGGLHAGWATFGDDPMGIDTMKYYGGSERIMWGNDYPHHEGTWPHSEPVVERTMGHLTETERRNILGLNAAKLYGFDVPVGFGV